MMDFKLHLDPWGRLVLTDVQGKQHVGVETVRGFPISAPRYGISLVDKEGRELVWITNFDQLPVAEKELLESELPRREFLPTLHRVMHVSGVAEPTEWHIETDRGSVKFILNSEEDIRRLSGGQAMIIDSHGIRYLIPNMDNLDPLTRRVLERYL